MVKSDRRSQRTRELLQKALVELLNERGYEAITIQDIVDRANVGRTAFYLHYGNKDELFVSCHEAIVSQFHFGPLYPLSREVLLSPDTPPGMISAYQHLDRARALLAPIFQGKDNLIFLRRILRDWNAQTIETNLREAFTEADSSVPFDVLANYLAGAHMAMVQWWLEKRHPYTSDYFAQLSHRLQRAAIRDALAISE